jgi:Spy/CpxP family protein refolding chaperone
MTTKLIVMLGFLMAFGAGLMTGLRSQPQQQQIRATAPPPPAPTTGSAGTTRPFGPRGDRGSFLTRELSLTPDQQEQMKQIWSPMARSGPREQDERRRQYRNERDEAIANLIRTEDLKAYNTILEEFQAKLTALDDEFRKSYDAAVEKTKAILTTEQRAKYEEILKRVGPGGDRPPHGGPGGPGGPDHGPPDHAGGPDRRGGRG